MKTLSGWATSTFLISLGVLWSCTAGEFHESAEYASAGDAPEVGRWISIRIPHVEGGGTTAVIWVVEREEGQEDATTGTYAQSAARTRLKPWDFDREYRYSVSLVARVPNYGTSERFYLLSEYQMKNGVLAAINIGGKSRIVGRGVDFVRSLPGFKRFRSDDQRTAEEVSYIPEQRILDFDGTGRTLIPLLDWVGKNIDRPLSPTLKVFHELVSQWGIVDGESLFDRAGEIAAGLYGFRALSERPGAENIETIRIGTVTDFYPSLDVMKILRATAAQTHEDIVSGAWARGGAELLQRPLVLLTEREVLDRRSLRMPLLQIEEIARTALRPQGNMGDVVARIVAGR